MSDKLTGNDIEKAILDTVKKIAIENAVKGEPVYTLLEMLAQKSTTALKELAKRHRIRRYTKMDKTELVNAIHRSILDVDRLCEFLYIIDEADMNFFQKAASKKHLQDDKAYITTHHILQLQSAGYLQSYYYKGKVYFVVPDEVKKLFASLEKTDFYKNKEYYDLLNAYAMAATNLYGIIKRCDFVELFNSQNSRKTSIDEMSQILMKYIQAKMGYCFYDEYIVNDDFEDDDFKYVSSLAMAIQHKPRYTPPKTEFLKYADYDYYEITPQIMALKNYINKNLTNDPDITEDIVDEIHDLCMQEAKLQAFIDVFEKHDIIFDSFEQVQQIMMLVTDVQNNTRLWVNRGHTPIELLNIFEKQRLKPLPKEPLRVQKIGRNEPCPCGSGKKYKKCCGK